MLYGVLGHLEGTQAVLYRLAATQSRIEQKHDP
jgi:hypothetical protein